MYEFDRRSHGRNVSLNTIQFCLVHDNAGETHLGATINVSDSGMCVITSNPLRQGESIIIKNELSLLSQMAMVRWVRNYQHNFCKAGLMFVE